MASIQELETALREAHDRWLDEDTDEAWTARGAAYEALAAARAEAAQERTNQVVRDARAAFQRQRSRWD